MDNKYIGVGQKIIVGGDNFPQNIHNTNFPISNYLIHGYFICTYGYRYIGICIEIEI